MEVSLKNVLISEILKTKKKHILSASILLPLIITVLSSVINIQYFFDEDLAVLGGNPWRSLCVLLFECYKFLYPVLMIIICVQLYEVKQTSNESEKVFVGPVSKTYLYCSRAIILVFCLFISLLIAFSLTLLTGEICSKLYPLMKFQDYMITDLIGAFFVKSFFFNLSITAIQLLLSIFFTNVILLIGTPLFLMIIGNTIFRLAYNYLFPYSYSFQAALDFENGDSLIIDKMLYWSMFYSIFFFVFGAFVVRLQKVYTAN